MNLRYHIVSKRSEEDEEESSSTTVDGSKTISPVNGEPPNTTIDNPGITSSFVQTNATTTTFTTTTTSSIFITPSITNNSTNITATPVLAVPPLLNQTAIVETPSSREFYPTITPDNNNEIVNVDNKPNNGLGKGIGISIGVSLVVLVTILSIVMKYKRNNKREIASRSIPVLEIEKSEDVQSDSENKDNIPYYSNDTSFNYNANESFYTGAPTTNTDPYSPVHSSSIIQRKPTNQATVATNSSITCTNNYISSNADYNANTNDSFSGYPNWNQSSVNNSNMIANHENNVPYSRNISSAVAAATMGTNPDSNIAQEQNEDKKSTSQIQSHNSLISNSTTEPLYKSAQSPNINRSGSRNESCIGQVNAPQNDSLVISQIRNSQTESLTINPVHSPRIESFMGQGSRVISPRIGSLCMKNSFIDELRSEYSTYERPSVPTKMEGSMISLTMPRPEESYYANSPMCSSIKDSFFSNRDSTVLRNATLVPEFVESSVIAEPMVPEIIETVSSTAPDSPRQSFEEVSSTNGLISSRRLSLQPPRTGYRSPDMHYQKHLSLISVQSLQSLQSDNSNKQFIHSYDTLSPNLPIEKVKPFVIEEESGVNITVEKKKMYTSSINDDNQHVDELNF